MMITRKKYLAVLAVACLVNGLLSFSAKGAQSVYDPNGLDALINSNEVAIQDEIGNYTIAEFNANLDTIVFTMETEDGYPAAGAGTQIDQIVLTEMVSGLDLTISLDPIATFGRIVDNVEDGATSGSNSLAYKADKTQSVSVAIRFDHGVSGVGLTINRILDDFPVTVYDGNNNPIASYVVPANGAGHSFFGHYAETAEIRRIVLDVGADQRESQFWLDDLAVIAGLPAPCGGDPNYINSNCRSMSSQVGNFTLEEFNSYNTMELFNFEDPGGVYPAVGDRVSILSASCTAINFEPVSPYGRIMTSESESDRASSGLHCLAYNTKNSLEAVIRMGSDVYGVGFVLSRLVADVGVTFYDSSDVEIGSYIVPQSANVTDNFSFVGYFNKNAAQVRKIVFDMTGHSGSQWYLDDLAIICRLANCDEKLAGDINSDCYVNLLDLGIMAANWMTCHPDYPDCE